MMGFQEIAGLRHAYQGPRSRALSPGPTMPGGLAGALRRRGTAAMVDEGGREDDGERRGAAEQQRCGGLSSGRRAGEDTPPR
jgi:hypothetical protein